MICNIKRMRKKNFIEKRFVKFYILQVGVKLTSYQATYMERCHGVVCYLTQCQFLFVRSSHQVLKKTQLDTGIWFLFYPCPVDARLEFDIKDEK